MPHNEVVNGCQVCGYSGEMATYRAREMMFGMDEEFTYAECPVCGVVQLVDVPQDLSPYYPANYYAFSEVAETVSFPRRFIRSRRAAHVLGKPNFIGKMFANRSWGKNYLRWLAQMNVKLDSAILDVGCGTGILLRELAAAGLTNLTGVDPFIAESLTIGKIRIHKETLAEHQGSYDAIMLNHCFEHMAEPVQVLPELVRLLKPGGTIMIRIPVADSYAWRHYGVNWVQLDAPRHLFLHTRKSMDLLAREVGLEVTSVEYDSYHFQFLKSELYLRGIPLIEQEKQEYFTPEETADADRRANELNEKGEGDQAVFFLSRPKRKDV